MKKIIFLSLFAWMLCATACKKEDEKPAAPAAMFTLSPTTAEVDELVTFTNTSTNATAFNWSFGDGTTSTEKAPVKAYTSTGQFNITLVTTGAGGIKSAESSILITPRALFEVLNESNLTAGSPVTFINKSKGATSYLWAFGDSPSGSSTEEDPSYIYSAPGTYTVILVASGNNSTMKSYSKTITVNAPPQIKELYFTEYGSSTIKKFNLDAAATLSNVLDVTGKAGVGLEYDVVNGKVYFSDFEIVNQGKIWRMNLDGSNPEAIVTGINDPYGIALDVSGGKIYWTDDGGNVSRANLDGSSPQIGIINIPSGQMRAISLDPENNKMYFYEVNLENLFVANLDGSNRSVLVSAVYGYDILVDKVNDKLYFDDQNSNTLIRSNLDGSNRITIDANGTRIYGMDIDYSQGKLYWSGRDSGNIMRANLDGTSPEMVKSGLLSPRGLFLKL